MPLRRRGQLRKRWRYLGVFGEELMLCAARAEVGPLGQCFWIVLDRASGRQWAHTSLRPGGREVRIEGARLEIDAEGLRASLRLGASAPIEALCPSGRAWSWTRKRAGVPVEGTVEVPGRRWRVSALGVDDESAGYHARRTSWHWSAGVGRSVDGRAVAWNLVAGVNDPPEGSERAIWVDGEPHEPAPVRFREMQAIELAGGRLLEFEAESGHARDENLLLIRSRYRHRFGSFRGALGELDLAEGLGVMEQHDALW
ncbi:MAG TPA: DUF2804 family protein [Solirubrobacterales bacterium]|jgi:hypothetical protein|nr:DUF2804 family protein [Solirubrobacterales bacterium]